MRQTLVPTQSVSMSMLSTRTHAAARVLVPRFDALVEAEETQRTLATAAGSTAAATTGARWKRLGVRDPQQQPQQQQQQHTANEGQKPAVPPEIERCKPSQVWHVDSEKRINLEGRFHKLQRFREGKLWGSLELLDPPKMRGSVSKEDGKDMEKEGTLLAVIYIPTGHASRFSALEKPPLSVPGKNQRCTLYVTHIRPMQFKTGNHINERGANFRTTDQTQLILTGRE
ncbi:hypothetical protein DUNSADRAFT_4004 [Dunaliella salina]|uniref:Encoded protein n=1 Tax=Dunaliella salina TaxID=3046 RepID=A0ABQ7GSV2_DUNSA|nr:hypothetical protein DUNSADRAFT_4004 [Dunaliella salina]|eukprot:KAF5837694.1 hypothetical protein DUNSADRAFT_4004 [Dunaliella salina]